MSNNSDFFGDVFDDPADDPLLGEEGSGSDDRPHSPQSQKPPSWMSEDSRSDAHSNGRPASNGKAASHGNEDESNQKQIVVDQGGTAGGGIEALNRAVGDGWRLVRISLARPDGEQAATARDAHRFVATLEQERPQSLFDFGAA
jgi:hypothetical protein